MKKLIIFLSLVVMTSFADAATRSPNRSPRQTVAPKKAHAAPKAEARRGTTTTTDTLTLPGQVNTQRRRSSGNLKDLPAAQEKARKDAELKKQQAELAAEEERLKQEALRLADEEEKKAAAEAAAKTAAEEQVLRDAERVRQEQEDERKRAAEAEQARISSELKQAQEAAARLAAEAEAKRAAEEDAKRAAKLNSPDVQHDIKLVRQLKKFLKEANNVQQGDDGSYKAFDAFLKKEENKTIDINLCPDPDLKKWGFRSGSEIVLALTEDNKIQVSIVGEPINLPCPYIFTESITGTERKEPTFCSMLHYAAGKGNVYLMDCLLANGANHLVVDEDNETILHYAVREGLPIMVHHICLLPSKKRSTLINKKNNDNETALDLADELEESDSEKNNSHSLKKRIIKSLEEGGAKRVQSKVRPIHKAISSHAGGVNVGCW